MTIHNLMNTLENTHPDIELLVLDVEGDIVYDGRYDKMTDTMFNWEVLSAHINAFKYTEYCRFYITHMTLRLDMQ